MAPLDLYEQAKMSEQLKIDSGPFVWFLFKYEATALIGSFII